ncbi:tRNA uridine-5-carboxymethylaminomethyl(34) synthesis GTPase MnmE [Desulfofalx alkaliphila]|uniref:tRNA uridine-5-carboxymethylaminomethyl(34) synthesis GTPase MnmE n=1 Tax=Desulfofalx alkaliphila TaxID=105483 RepID=UPI0004E249C2|nr:tRNA uridine-5-carboxymethylaminomethyl(34) synthesis GTPase MnmE [Desulfofalx alkaliphila]
MLEDTIAAIATPLGEAGIGIIRISGPHALDIAGRIFKPKYNTNWASEPGFRMVYGQIINPKNKEVIDEVLVSKMIKPKSFTGEDVVEINCHGGILPLRKTLELVVSNGARLAEPGEFSKRAFLNGRLDLAQAESIIDVIRSQTEAGLKLSMGQLQGKLSKKINELQDHLLGMLAQIEANIDFPEDDIEEASIMEIHNKSREIIKEISRLIEGAESGRIYREGVQTLIVGRPNVGKSSLLNALLKEDRAIVTDIPGTTRDIIEEIVNIGGIPLKIIDTAGLRETEDIVEKIGVDRTKELINKVDLVLFVLDAADGYTQEDEKIFKEIQKKKIIVIVNKIDIKDNKIKEIESKFNKVIELSALLGEGLDILENKITDLVLGGKVNIKDEVLVTNMRHKQALEKAKHYTQEVIDAINKGVPPDLISIDVKNAWEALGEITGTSVGEDLIDRIFKDFCIGK